MSIEAMKLALEALERLVNDDEYWDAMANARAAITALRTAIAEAKKADYADEADTEELLQLGKLPEPLRLAAMLERTAQWPLHGKAADCLRKMYAAQRQPLTEEEIAEIMDYGQYGGRVPEYAKNFVRAIEAAHGIGGEA